MITSFGYFAIVIVLATIFLTIKIVKRAKNNGCISYGYNFLLIFSAVSFFLSTSYMTLESLNVYLLGKSYKGK